MGVFLLFLSTTALCAENDPSEATPSTDFDIENLSESLQQHVEATPSADGRQASSKHENFLIEQLLSERWHVVLLCILSIFALALVLFILKATPNHTARDIVNASGLNLIIFGTILLVLIVDTTEQLTAAIGVLGAIAGYLFGTIQKREARSE